MKTTIFFILVCLFSQVALAQPRVYHYQFVNTQDSTEAIYATTYEYTLFLGYTFPTEFKMILETDVNKEYKCTRTPTERSTWESWGLIVCKSSDNTLEFNHHVYDDVDATYGTLKTSKSTYTLKSFSGERDGWDGYRAKPGCRRHDAYGWCM